MQPSWKESAISEQRDRRSILGWAATVAGAGISVLSATPVGAQAGTPISLKFSEFYDASTTPLQFNLSEKLLSANGRRVTISGWVAPPLKPDLDFFVLTGVASGCVRSVRPRQIGPKTSSW